MRFLTLCTITLLFLTVGVEPVVREVVAQSAPVMHTIAGPDGALRLDAASRGMRSDGLRQEIQSIEDAGCPHFVLDQRSDHTILLALTSREVVQHGPSTEALPPMREAA